MEEEDARRLRSYAFSRKSTDDENSNSNDGKHEESSVKVSFYVFALVYRISPLKKNVEEIRKLYNRKPLTL